MVAMFHRAHHHHPTATRPAGRTARAEGLGPEPRTHQNAGSPAGSDGGVFCCTDRNGTKRWNRSMDFSKLDGLIPAVVQDHASGEVLMVGFMNQEAWDMTRRTGYVTFFSRTRNTLWTKGETSGNRLAVRDILIDCDEDTVLVKAELPRRRQRVPHRRAHLLLSARGGRDDSMKLKLGIPKGSLQDATIQLFRARRLQHLRQLALVLPVDRRSGDRVHADPRAGDGALRLRRRARRRPHRARTGSPSTSSAATRSTR